MLTEDAREEQGLRPDQAGQINEPSQRRASAEPARVLSISYDRDLLFTRELMLTRAGHRVSSFLRLENAVHECSRKQFDLVIIGHTVYDHDRKSVDLIRQALSSNNEPASFGARGDKSGRVPILVLRRPDGFPIPSADYELDPLRGPEAFVNMVNAILRQPQQLATAKSED